MGNIAFWEEFYESQLYLADSTVFWVFTHDFIYGDPRPALVEPYSLVITASTARKYFGTRNPIGEVVHNAENETFKITGVIEDLPGNSHLKFDGLISWATAVEKVGAERLNDNSASRFWNVQTFTYVLLKEHTRMADIIAKFPAFYDKYMREIGDKLTADST